MRLVDGLQQIFLFKVTGLTFKVPSANLLFLLVGLGNYLAPGIFCALNVVELILGQAQQRALRTDASKCATISFSVVYNVFFAQQTPWTVNG